MKPENVREEVAAALSREEPLRFAECVPLMHSVVTAMAEVGDRLARITPGSSDGKTPAGPEFKRALQTGTEEQIRALEDEFKRTSVLAAQLKAQREELDGRRQEARLREAEAGMPDMQARLLEKLGSAEQARAQMVQALSELTAVADEINQARAVIRMHRYGGAPGAIEGGATVRTLQRLAKLEPAFNIDGRLARYPQDWMHKVGCAVTERVYRDAMIKAPNADYADCKTDEEVKRKAVEAIFGSRTEDDCEIDYAFGALPPYSSERLVA